MSTTMIARLVLDLHKANLRSHTGAWIVHFLAIFSLTVSATVAFLVAGGTWLFWQRSQHPEDATALVREELSLNDWLILSLFACAFILPALFSLTAQAAVLGASGRERRLATLRLLGLSSRDVTRITVLETGSQALVGIGLGLAASFLTAPVFTSLSFQQRPIALQEILLPWWGYLAVAALLFLLALGAAIMGMQRVRVTPLGVARQAMPTALKRWRILLFLIIFALVALVMNGVNLASQQTGIMLATIGFLFLLLLCINAVSPYLLQVYAKMLVFLPGTAHLVACRRISGHPKAAWKRSSPLVFFGFLAGFLIISPLVEDDVTRVYREEPKLDLLFGDVSTGAILTLFFGFLITSTSVFLGQASEVFESAALSRSLSLLGVQRRFLSRIVFIEVMLPIFLLGIFGFCCGTTLANLMLAIPEDGNVPARIGLSLGLLVAGWAVTMLAVLAAEPLRTRVLSTQSRKND